MGAGAGRGSALSVTEAVQLVSGQVKALPRLVVVGEVTNFRGPNARKGHCYFQVKDRESSMEVTVFSWVYQKSGVTLQDGLEVQLVGRFDVWGAKGKLSFIADALSVAGEGLLRQQVAALAKRLDAEGLMADARKRRVPAFCERVVVCTSLSGSVLGDVERTLRRRNPLVVVQVVGCGVQGKDAPPTIVRALAVADAARPDAILLVRGGGSYEDLMCFNDEGVARAIAACRAPVVTGIGHEPDVTIADMVADRRASTPTAAAESVAPDLGDIVLKMNERARRLASSMADQVGSRSVALDSQELRGRQAMRSSLAARQARLDALAQRRCLTDPAAPLKDRLVQVEMADQRLSDALPRMLAQRSERTEALAQRLEGVPARSLAARGQQVAHQGQRLASAGQHLTAPYARQVAGDAGKLDALSPLKVLARGYAIPYGPRGHVLTDASSALPGDALSVRLANGFVDATVIGTRLLGAGAVAQD